MLWFFLSTIDHRRLYFVLKIKVPNFLPRAASVHVLVRSFYAGDVPNVYQLMFIHLQEITNPVGAVAVVYSRDFRHWISTSLKESGDRCFYRGPQISLQNWKYCVLVPSIDISSKSTWRGLDCFWTSREKDNHSLSLYSMIQVHSQTSAHSLGRE